MMPFREISNAKNLVNELKAELPFIKDENKRKRQGKRINQLIDLIESFESMLENRYYTDAIETLIYSFMYEWFLQAEIFKGKEIPIAYLFDTLKTDINYGSNMKKAEVIELLKDHEMAHKIKNNEVFSCDNVNFNILLNELMQTLKEKIRWQSK